MADLVVWSPKAQRTVRLTPTGVSGGQTELFRFKDDPGLCAAVPVGGNWPPAYWDKIEALIDIADPSVDAAFPIEVLCDPRDRRTPLAFAMKTFNGRPHTELVIPAERVAQGLNWGPLELRKVAVRLARLFERFEALDVTQNDAHGEQYLIEWPKGARAPSIGRVDALAFGFHWKGRYFGCDVAVFEFVAPEHHGRGVDLSTVVFTRDSDRYSLACLLFPLLTDGGYPWGFSGGTGTAAERVGRKEFALFSNPRGTKVPPAVEAAFNRLPDQVKVLFERAFLSDARPSPLEWVQALKLIGAGQKTKRLRVATGRFKGVWPRVAGVAKWARGAVKANGWMVVAVVCTALGLVGVPKGSPVSDQATGASSVPQHPLAPQPTTRDRTPESDELVPAGRTPKDPGAWTRLE